MAQRTAEDGGMAQRRAILVAMEQRRALDGGDGTTDTSRRLGWHRGQQWMVRMAQQTAETGW